MVATLVGLSGCVAHGGRTQSLDVSRLAREPGWLVAAHTPEVRQREAQDCGAASLAMIAGRWGVPLSVDAVIEALPAPAARGARLGDLRDVARARGLQAFAITGDRATLLRELRAGRPSIVGLVMQDGRSGQWSHFEVIVAAQEADAQYVTIDPAAGWRVRSWTDLDAAWSPGGRPMLVVVGPTPVAPAKAMDGRASP
jgi:ABC-type bacteriocin/lantibiotic exporter with double-glycine peptidase domain